MADTDLTFMVGTLIDGAYFNDSEDRFGLILRAGPRIRSTCRRSSKTSCASMPRPRFSRSRTRSSPN